MTARGNPTNATPFFFPVTPFDNDGRLDAAALHDHIRSQMKWNPRAVVVASGAGEFHALAQEEVDDIVEVAIDAVAGAAPVIVGTGGQLGHATRIAVSAHQRGAAALLVLPPYLIEAGDEGLTAYIETVVSASGLPVIVYHRRGGALTADSMRRLVKNELVTGVKDGVGDLGLLERLMAIANESGRDLQFFNGLPTAELHHADYERIGVTTYSSAVFTMAPHIAEGFRNPQVPDLRATLIRGFFTPLAALRDETPGHAVSLIKAALRLRGIRVGSVRPPLVDPSPDQTARLGALLEHGSALVAGSKR